MSSGSLFQQLKGWRGAFLFFAGCVCGVSIARAQTAIPAIGQWRDHLNYKEVTQVIKGDKIYCATTSAVFSVDAGNNIERYSKVSGLNDIGVQCIGWDASTQQLIVAYNNSNLDVLKNNSTKNIGDIKRSSIAGNKTIYSVFCREGFAYLSTGLGVIVANLSKYEIADTWFIGANGGQVKVNALVRDNNFFFAATDEGLKSIPVTNTNPSDYANWQLLSGANGLGAGAVKNVMIANGRLVVEKNDSLFIQNGSNWQLLYADAGWPFVSTGVSENRILICQKKATAAWRVAVLNVSGQVEKTVSPPTIAALPRSAFMESDGSTWIADQFGGLVRVGAQVDNFVPNGPLGTADGEFIIRNQKLYAAAGSVNSAWNYQYNRNGVFSFIEGYWDYKGFYNVPLLDSVLDFITVAIDPVDESVWAGSYGGGLVHFLPSGQPRLYKKNNSTLQPAIGDANSYRVSGLAFDQQRNLWISNYGAAQNLQVRKSDSTWKAFTIPFAHTENAVAQIIVDDYNQLWIASPKDNGVFCFNYGADIDNTLDDKWKFYKQGAGNGNLPSNTVLSMAIDRNGFIWVGTDKGIGIIQCAGDVFKGSGCDALLPVVQLDRFAGYLFRDELVQAIAVDGANRKWIGTKNGLWLVSADGSKMIYRFTAENSPLLNNDIKRIAIDGASGEVFVSTLYGICSFRSTATEGTETNSDVLVFPNPVPPSYGGTIAVRGLVNNAIVKITELNGRLVFQGRALGGQFVWNGRNYLGNKIASGIYLVMVRDDSGEEKTVTKIVITSGK